MVALSQGKRDFSSSLFSWKANNTKHVKSQLRQGASATSCSHQQGKRRDSNGCETFIESMQAVCRRASIIQLYYPPK